MSAKAKDITMNNLNHLLYEIDQQGLINALREGLEAITDASNLQDEFIQVIREYGGVSAKDLTELGFITNRVLYLMNDYYHVCHNEQDLVIDEHGEDITEQEYERAEKEHAYENKTYEGQAL